MTMIEKVANAIRDSFNSNDVDCYLLAKAAIEAMREPTEEMIYAAGSSPVTSDWDINIKCNWQIMIDVALKE